jgi:hypothetical protein
MQPCLLFRETISESAHPQQPQANVLANGGTFATSPPHRQNGAHAIR